MKFCKECGQRLSQDAEVCPVCGHTALDATEIQENPYEPLKYSHGVSYREKQKKPVLTIIFIVLNVIVFAVINLLSMKDIDLGSVLSMHRGAVASGQYYRILTSIFTHEGFTHLLSNCYALLIYGMILEPSIGKGRFLAVYFAGGILGNILTFAFMANPSIGASGAIFGLLGALIAIHFINPTGMSSVMLVNAIVCIVATTIYGVAGNVNNIAHFGGLFGGYMAMCMTIGYRAKKRVYTSRPLMSFLLCFLLVFGVIFGIPQVKSADERRYGDYTNMVFYSSIDMYDRAYPYAVAISEDETSDYSFDAQAFIMVKGYIDGDEEMKAKAFDKITKYINEGRKMHDEKIYNQLMDFLKAEEQ